MRTSHEDRERIARRAYEELGSRPSGQAVLRVQCSASHHLASVHDTPAGRVYHTFLHARAHGRRDFEDAAHHASRNGQDWFDLLDAGDDPVADDDLPAGCECGPHTLSRRELADQIAAGEKKVIIR